MLLSKKILTAPGSEKNREWLTEDVVGNSLRASLNLKISQ